MMPFGDWLIVSFYGTFACPITLVALLVHLDAPLYVLYLRLRSRRTNGSANSGSARLSAHSDPAHSSTVAVLLLMLLLLLLLLLRNHYDGVGGGITAAQ